MAISDYKSAQFISLKRFTYVGEQLEPGQYFDPKFAVHDRTIFGSESRLAAPAPPSGERQEWKCDRCGRYFVTEGHLRGHQRYLYAVEHTDPEHIASLREEEGKRVGRRLKETTMADIAAAQGREVRINERGIPMIQPQ